MPQICLYLQLHQPYRLEDFNVFNLGKSDAYFSSSQRDINRDVMKKVSFKSYLPMLELLNRLIIKHPQFKFAISCSGVFLDQALEFEPKIIQLIKQSVDSGRVELLAETYYHSLSFLYSSREFIYQIKKHSDFIEYLFGFSPNVFRNTELIYQNDLLKDLKLFNFKGALTEAVDRYLNGQKKTQVFASKKVDDHCLPLLLKHSQLSDDVAFRFGEKSWNFYPLTADKYLEWVEVYPEDEIVNLFMDFETFGEHQWADTGIFIFFEYFVNQFLAKSWNSFKTPSEIFDQLRSNCIQKQGGVEYHLPEYDVPELISWADVDRSITAWRDNDFQYDALRTLYQLQDEVLRSGNEKLTEDWRKLQTSDHFYYMCTKWSADGDVHAYFSPYDSPQEAYRRFSIVLADLRERLL
jgi:alpha-amylase